MRADRYFASSGLDRYVEGLIDARTPLADFFSILLLDDVAHKIVQGRIGDLDLDEFPCCG
jgi:hypothetical protein